MTAQELYNWCIDNGDEHHLITSTIARCKLTGLSDSIDVSGINAVDFARCYNADFAGDRISDIPESLRSTFLSGFLPEWVYNDLMDIDSGWGGRFTDIVTSDGFVMEFKYLDSCDDIRYFGRRDPDDNFRLGNPEPVVWSPYLREAQP